MIAHHDGDLWFTMGDVDVWDPYDLTDRQMVEFGAAMRAGEAVRVGLFRVAKWVRPISPPW